MITDATYAWTEWYNIANTKQFKDIIYDFEINIKLWASSFLNCIYINLFSTFETVDILKLYTLRNCRHCEL